MGQQKSASTSTTRMSPLRPFRTSRSMRSSSIFESSFQVVSVTVYLSDIELYGAFNEVYAARFSEPYPARTCVAVAALPAGAQVHYLPL